MSIYFLNNKSTNDSWDGLSINSGSYSAALSLSERSRFLDHNKTITDIGNDDLVVSTSQDSSGHLGIAAGIAELSLDRPIRIAEPFPDNEGGYSFIGEGGTSPLVSGVNAPIDILIDANSTSLINGFEIWTDSLSYGDYFTFQIVNAAKDLVRESSRDWQIHPNQPTVVKPGYVGSISAGYFIRIIVNAGSTCDLYYNLHLHQ